MQAPMAQGLKTLERLRRWFAPTAREFAPTTDEKVVKCSRLEHLEAEVLAFGTGSLRSARMWNTLKPRCLHSERDASVFI